MIYDLLCELAAQIKKTYIHRTAAGTHTHTHTFNDPLSGTTRVSRYQKDKTSLDFPQARDSEWHGGFFRPVLLWVLRNAIFIPINSRNVLMKSVSFYLERLQKYGVLKNVQLFQATLYMLGNF